MGKTNKKTIKKTIIAHNLELEWDGEELLVHIIEPFSRERLQRIMLNKIEVGKLINFLEH